MPGSSCNLPAKSQFAANRWESRAIHYICEHSHRLSDCHSLEPRSVISGGLRNVGGRVDIQRSGRDKRDDSSRAICGNRKDCRYRVGDANRLRVQALTKKRFPRRVCLRTVMGRAVAFTGYVWHTACIKRRLPRRSPDAAVWKDSFPVEFTAKSDSSHALLPSWCYPVSSRPEARRLRPIQIATEWAMVLLNPLGQHSGTRRHGSSGFSEGSWFQFLFDFRHWPGLEIHPKKSFFARLQPVQFFGSKDA